MQLYLPVHLTLRYQTHPMFSRPVPHAQLEVYDPQEHVVDFCVTLGGDGTVLHLASLFDRDAPLPPIISFAMGSL